MYPSPLLRFPSLPSSLLSSPSTGAASLFPDFSSAVACFLCIIIRFAPFKMDSSFLLFPLFIFFLSFAIFPFSFALSPHSSAFPSFLPSPFFARRRLLLFYTLSSSMLSPSAIPLFLRTSLFKTINVKERRDPDSHREKREERGNVDGGRVMGGQKGEARGGGGSNGRIANFQFL